jgi:hypothetical protein
VSFFFGCSQITRKFWNKKRDKIFGLSLFLLFGYVAGVLVGNGGEQKKLHHIFRCAVLVGTGICCPVVGGANRDAVLDGKGSAGQAGYAYDIGKIAGADSGVDVG